MRKRVTRVEKKMATEVLEKYDVDLRMWAGCSMASQKLAAHQIKELGKGLTIKKDDGTVLRRKDWITKYQQHKKGASF